MVAESKVTTSSLRRCERLMPELRTLINSQYRCIKARPRNYACCTWTPWSASKFDGRKRRRIMLLTLMLLLTLLLSRLLLEMHFRKRCQ